MRVGQVGLLPTIAAVLALFSPRTASAATCEDTADACAAGEFLDPESSACAACPGGFHRAAAADPVCACTACPQGFFTEDASGADACAACPVGWGTRAFRARTACSRCLAGEFSGGPGGACAACPAGWVQPHETGVKGAAEPASRPAANAGLDCAAAGASCAVVPRGAYKHHGAADPQLRAGPFKMGNGNDFDPPYTVAACAAACPTFRFFALRLSGGARMCTCEDDWAHATNKGTATCGPLGAGYCNYIYEQVPANAACAPCPAGTGWPGAGGAVGACAACPAGYHLPRPGPYLALSLLMPPPAKCGDPCAWG